jgi:hypothetical protein
MFQRFLDAADYWFDYFDNSSAGSYDPARECFVVVTSNQANAMNTAGAGDEEAPPEPERWTVSGRGAERTPTSPPRGADINTQLAQACELEAKQAESSASRIF